MPGPVFAALVSFLLALALPARALAQHVAATPPPERRFGPDRASTHVFTGAGLVPAGLACDAPADPSAPLTCEGYLPSFDGTLLETTVRVPRPAGLHPLVVGMHGWGGSRGSMPNGRPERAHEVAGAQKLSYVEALFLGGLRTRVDRPYPNYPSYLVRWNAELSLNELPYAATPVGAELVDALQGHRSAWWQAPLWARARANAAAGAPQLPILAVQGFTDDLFPAREAVRMADALRAVDPGYPIALYLGDLGHPRAANKPEEVAHALGRVLAWLGWWLAGRGTQPAFDVEAAITRPRDAPFDAAGTIRAPTFAQLANAVASAEFQGYRVLTFDPANVAGVQWDPLVLEGCGQLQPCPPAPESQVVPGDVAVYDAPVSRFGEGSLLVAGEPTFSAWVLSPAHRVQLDVRVLDVAPGGARRLVTRGTLTLDSGAEGTALGLRRAVIPTFGNLWEVPAGHVLRFEVTNVDSPYLRPSLVPSATLVVGARVSVPVRR